MIKNSLERPRNIVGARTHQDWQRGSRWDHGSPLLGHVFTENVNPLRFFVVPSTPCFIVLWYQTVSFGWARFISLILWRWRGDVLFKLQPTEILPVNSNLFCSVLHVLCLLMNPVSDVSKSRSQEQ